MPLEEGTSKRTISENIREFHHGPTFEHTKRKFGKRRAQRQAIAAAESEARRSKRKKSHRR